MNRRLAALVALFALVVGSGALWWLSARESTSPLAVTGTGASRARAEAAEAGLSVDPQPDDARRSVPPSENEPAQEDATGAWLEIVDPGGEAVRGRRFEVARVEVLSDERGLSMQRGSTSFVTDERGRAELSPALQGAEPVESVVLSCEDNPSIRFEPPRLSWEALGATPGEACRVVQNVREVASPRGLVVDAADGKPVADYSLRPISWFEDHAPAGASEAERYALRFYHGIGDGLEWVTTDSSGRFVFERELPATRLDFWSAEMHPVEGEHRIGPDGLGVEMRLEVDIGPIVRLDFDPPNGLAPTDFIAAVRRDGNVHPAYIHEFLSPLDPHHGKRYAHSGNAAAVRDDERPWVRIPAGAANRPLPSFLVLESRDRQHYGSALIESFERHATEPLRVELATRAVQTIEVQWPTEERDARPLDMIQVWATPVDALADDPDAEPTAYLLLKRVRDEPRTPALLVGFEPGRHSLVAGGRRVPGQEVTAVPIELELELPRDEALLLKLELEPAEELHRVEGIIRTASGRALDGQDGRALLFLSAGTWGDLDGRIRWSEGVGHFSLEAAAGGPRELRTNWFGGWFPMQPAKLVVDPPCPPLEILVLDDLPTERVSLRVIEPRRPGRVEIELGTHDDGFRAYARFEPDELTRLPDGRRAFELTTGPYAAGTPVRSITLEMEGYEHAWLAERDVPVPDADGLRVVELVPRPGWSARVQVVTATPGSEVPTPEAGVVMAFDGVESAASDDEGRFVHRAAREPARLSVVTPGYELIDRSSYLGQGSVFASSGRFTTEDGELTVLVRRVPR